MGLSKSTYYFELSNADQVSERNKELASEISIVFEKHKGRYGVRRVYHELRNLGYEINHKRVQRLMHAMKFLGKRPKEKYHSYMGQRSEQQTNT